jgi:hypothetical protein
MRPRTLKQLRKSLPTRVFPNHFPFCSLSRIVLSVFEPALNLAVSLPKARHAFMSDDCLWPGSLKPRLKSLRR